MTVDELLELNNERRKLLTKENLKYYEDIILYVRLADDKSEQEIEEILAELLDHLIQAQHEGRTAQQIFGNNPKQYLNEIIGELPKLVTKKRTLTFTMAILYFFAAGAACTGIFDIITSYVFHLNEPIKEVYIGSFVVKNIVSIPIVFVLLYTVIWYFRWSCFRKINKAVELTTYWIFGVASTGIFLIVIFLIPKFGSVIGVPVYAALILGILLFLAAHVTRKAI